jgi:hypothetical protein
LFPFLLLFFFLLKSIISLPASQPSGDKCPCDQAVIRAFLSQQFLLYEAVVSPFSIHEPFILLERIFSFSGIPNEKPSDNEKRNC